MMKASAQVITIKAPKRFHPVITAQEHIQHFSEKEFVFKELERLS